MFPFKNYNIYYFPTENHDGVEIYRVLHARRNIEGMFEDYFEGLGEYCFGLMDLLDEPRQQSLSGFTPQIMYLPVI